MDRKLYLNRGVASQEKSSYVKVLLWAAVGLVVVMLVATRITGIRGSKNGISKSSQEKGSAVVREIPKSPLAGTEGTQPVMPLVTEPKETADAKVPPLPGMQPLPESELKSATQASMKAGEPGSAAKEGVAAKSTPAAKDQPTPVTSTDAAASQAFKALDGVAPPPAPAPVKTPPQTAAKTAAVQPASPKPVVKPKEGAPSGTQAKPPGEAVKPKASGSEMYAVQVGSYQEKKHADEMQQNLKQKGYSVSVRTKPDPKGGQLYVVQLDPVPDKGKAHTLVAQIQNEEKVKPFVTMVQPGE